MNLFVVWHYLCRFGFFPLFAIAVAGMVTTNVPALQIASTIAIIAIFSLGITGATLAVLLLFTSFKIACPKCGGKKTEFGANKEHGMWLDCSDCGITEETGFLRLRLRHTPRSKAT